MAGLGGFSADGLEGLRDRLEKVRKENAEAFMEECAKELAARLLAKVIKRTPVGDYPKGSGRKGGTLRRGWTSKSHEEAAEGGGVSRAAEYAGSLEVRRTGNLYTVDIVNPVEYASYVEYGHRTRNGGWVDGRFMLTVSEQEVRQAAPGVLEAKIMRHLKECME